MGHGWEATRSHTGVPYAVQTQGWWATAAIIPRAVPAGLGVRESIRCRTDLECHLASRWGNLSFVVPVNGWGGGGKCGGLGGMIFWYGE